MISYSQNFEDIILNRALGDIHNGFYIDAGANDPTVASVTKHFYDNGWRGINIEPLPKHYKALCEQRPRDINLQVAVDSVAKKGILYEIEDVSGLSTLDKRLVERYRKEGFSVYERNIDVLTLQSIWEKYIDHEQSVHFLKIDVEGLEERVLKGIDLSKYRPWIILVESTEPNIGKEITGDFGLIKANYKKVYFDGLNSFYLAVEKYTSLEKFFKVPPNVFDHYRLALTVNLEKGLWNAQQKLTETEQKLTETEQKLTETEARYKDVISSASWRYTKVFRNIKSYLYSKT